MRRALLVLLFLAALGVRLYKVNEPPRDFRTERQYHMVLLTHSMYVAADMDAEDWKRAVAVANLERSMLVEPRIMETMTVAVHRFLGSEPFWVTRMWSILSWMVGGVFLYLLAKAFLGSEAALFALGYYLFLPFGVTMSRAFMPDSMMIMGLLASLFAIWKYFEKPSQSRLFIAAIVAGVAVFIKPGFSVFPIFLSFVMLSLHDFGFRGSLTRWQSYVFAVLMLLPAVVYTLLTGRSGDGIGYMGAMFTPQLLKTVLFWRGWVGILVSNLTLPGLILSLLGLLMFPRGKPCHVVLAMGLGYLALCFTTIWTTFTHEYYHLQVVPLAALGLGAVSLPVWNRLGREANPGFRIAVFALAAVWILLGIERAPWLRSEESDSGYPQIAAEIGDLVDHSEKVVYLDYDLGHPLCYFAGISGWFWPDSMSLWQQRVQGKPVCSAEERFAKEYRDKNPDYFVISRNLKELDLQPDLKEYLVGHFPLVKTGVNYVIFDLRHPVDNAGAP